MLRTLFVLAILVPGMVAAVSSRFAALLLYIWFALFRPQDWLWVDISSLRLSLILSVLVIIPRGWLLSDATFGAGVRERLAREAWPNLSHGLSLAMLLFLGTALFAQQYAINAPLGWEWLDFLWRLLLVSMVAVSLVNTPQRFRAVILVMAASIGFHATKAGISSLLGGGVRYEAGLGGAYIDNNGYALAMVMTLPFQMAIAQAAERPWVKWLFYGSILPSAYAIVSTFSRAGFLAMAVCVVCFIALQRRRVAGFIALAAVCVLLYLVVPIPKGYLDRLETIQTYEQVEEESALSRLHFWRVAVDMVRAQPYGVGLRNYDAAYDTYDFSGGRYGTGRSVHSSHFQVLAETGFVGAALWVGMFAYGFVICLRVRTRAAHMALSEADQRFYRTSADALAISMAGFLVGGAFIALALNDLTWLTFALVAALDRVSAKAVAEAVAKETGGVAPADAGVRTGTPAFTGAYRGGPTPSARTPIVPSWRPSA